MKRDRADYNKTWYESLKTDPERYADALKRKRERYAAAMQDPAFVKNQREKAKTWARNNPDKVRKTQRATQRRRAQWYTELKRSLKCERCGYDKHPAALDFHHRDPTTKSFGVGIAAGGGMPEALVRAEMEKCEVLCKNCHAELHNNEQGVE